MGEFSKLRFSDPEVECPWCKSVKIKYGSYWYPVKEEINGS